MTDSGMQRRGAVQALAAPAGALLHGWGREGSYRDGYALRHPGVVDLARFVEAFYTTPLFRAERALIGLLVRHPSTDAQAAALARGEIAAFSVWNQAGRRTDELLMADIEGRTCSWLAVRPAHDTAFDTAHRDADGGSTGRAGDTWLCFGSAIQPHPPVPGAPPDAPPRFGPLFRPLLGFHALYSRALLAAAARRLSTLTP